MQILGHWSGESQLTVAGQWLEAGKYLVQLALDPAFCRCQINAEGRLSCEASWKVQLLPSLEAKLCPITSDDSKAKWSQVFSHILTVSRKGWMAVLFVSGLT